MSHEEIFTKQYRWRSGPGSLVGYSAPYREFLSAFIAEHKVKSILDLGCGDMEIMSRVELHGAAYLGVDVIEERVIDNSIKCRGNGMSFEHRDLMSYELPEVDLVVCKDVVQHWPNAEISDFLERLQASPVRFALITNCNYGPAVNQDIQTGGWRPVDVTVPPFGVGSVVFEWGTQENGGEKDVVLIRGRETSDRASPEPTSVQDESDSDARPDREDDREGQRGR